MKRSDRQGNLNFPPSTSPPLSRKSAEPEKGLGVSAGRLSLLVRLLLVTVIRQRRQQLGLGVPRQGAVSSSRSPSGSADLVKLSDAVGRYCDLVGKLYG